MSKWMGVATLLLLCSNSALGEVSYSDLEWKNGLYIHKQQRIVFSGVTITRYSNGEIAEVQNFKSGVRHGNVKHYLPKGVLKYSASYKNGKQHGPSSLFDDNGHLSISSNHKNGQLDGLQEHYIDELYGRSNYKNGVLHGLSATYLNGKIIHEKCYRDAQEVNLSNCQN